MPLDDAIFLAAIALCGLILLHYIWKDGRGYFKDSEAN